MSLTLALALALSLVSSTPPLLQTSRFHLTSSSDSYSSRYKVTVANLVALNHKQSSNDNVIWSKFGLPNQSYPFIARHGPSNIVSHTDCLSDKFCRFCMAGHILNNFLMSSFS